RSLEDLLNEEDVGIRERRAVLSPIIFLFRGQPRGGLLIETRKARRFFVQVQGAILAAQQEKLQLALEWLCGAIELLLQGNRNAARFIQGRPIRSIARP